MNTKSLAAIIAAVGAAVLVAVILLVWLIWQRRRSRRNIQEYHNYSRTPRDSALHHANSIPSTLNTFKKSIVETVAPPFVPSLSPGNIRESSIPPLKIVPDVAPLPLTQSFLGASNFRQSQASTISPLKQKMIDFESTFLDDTQSIKGGPSKQSISIPKNGHHGSNKENGKNLPGRISMSKMPNATAYYSESSDEESSSTRSRLSQRLSKSFGFGTESQPSHSRAGSGTKLSTPHSARPSKLRQMTNDTNSFVPASTVSQGVTTVISGGGPHIRRNSTTSPLSFSRRQTPQPPTTATGVPSNSIGERYTAVDVWAISQLTQLRSPQSPRSKSRGGRRLSSQITPVFEGDGDLTFASESTVPKHGESIPSDGSSLSSYYSRPGSQVSLTKRYTASSSANAFRHNPSTEMPMSTRRTSTRDGSNP